MADLELLWETVPKRKDLLIPDVLANSMAGALSRVAGFPETAARLDEARKIIGDAQLAEFLSPSRSFPYTDCPNGV